MQHGLAQYTVTEFAVVVRLLLGPFVTVSVELLELTPFVSALAFTSLLFEIPSNHF